MKIKAGIIGATGYAGLELVRLLLNHPQAELAAMSSVSFEGKRLSDVYPAMRQIEDRILVDEDTVLDQCEVIFASLPHGLSQPLAARCDAAGKLLIDLGADFRLKDEEAYHQWYGGRFEDQALHDKSVYAVSELFREEIKGARIIANPGCYPTSAALGLAPLLKNGWAETEGIVIDSKSGTTGAGRNLKENTHFPNCNEAFGPYSVASHRHTPEIEETLTRLAGRRATITFVPHLLPVNRGIVSTMYVRLTGAARPQEAWALYEDFYRGEPFIRVLPQGQTANLRDVRCSNYCDISLHPDPHTGRLVVVSAIDNMVKGAAGQAIQNMNLALGLEETAGLGMIPPAF